MMSGMNSTAGTRNESGGKKIPRSMAEVGVRDLVKGMSAWPKGEQRGGRGSKGGPKRDSLAAAYAVLCQTRELGVKEWPRVPGLRLVLSNTDN